MADLVQDTDGKYDLSEETTKYLYRHFKSKDIDESGTLDREELEEALPIMGFYPSEQDINWVIKHFDTNKNGRLEIKELMNNLRVLNEHLDRKDEIFKAFKKFDTSGDNCIRIPELLKVLTLNDGMDPIEASKLVDDLVRKHDTNRDGKFNFEEFVNMYLDENYKFAENMATT